MAAACPAARAAATAAGDVTPRAALLPLNRRRISSATFSSPRAKARVRAIASRGRPSSGASASNSPARAQRSPPPTPQRPVGQPSSASAEKPSAEYVSHHCPQDLHARKEGLPTLPLWGMLPIESRAPKSEYGDRDRSPPLPPDFSAVCRGSGWSSPTKRGGHAAQVGGAFVRCTTCSWRTQTPLRLDPRVNKRPPGRGDQNRLRLAVRRPALIARADSAMSHNAARVGRRRVS